MIGSSDRIDMAPLVADLCHMREETSNACQLMLSMAAPSITGSSDAPLPNLPPRDPMPKPSQPQPFSYKPSDSGGKITLGIKQVPKKQAPRKLTKSKSACSERALVVKSWSESAERIIETREVLNKQPVL
jgi:hypothetical protein